MSVEQFERNHPESTRQQDMDAESQLAEFLDSYLYKPLLAEGHFKSIERVKEKKLQLQGIDVKASTATLTVRIDEKAQLHYINQNLPTFAFELSFQNPENGQLCTGWFLNEDLLTDYYLLIWPQAIISEGASVKKDDFTELDALMISRKKLHAFLDGKGFNQEVLKDAASDLRRNEKLGKTKTNQNGIYYVYTSETIAPEKPINLVIVKRHLLSLADMHYKITRNGFERLP